MSGFNDKEPTEEEINQYMQSLSAASTRMDGAAGPLTSDGDGSGYVASGTKYSGPLAVFKYEGGHKVHPETGNKMMHTSEGEVARVQGVVVVEEVTRMLRIQGRSASCTSWPF